DTGSRPRPRPWRAPRARSRAGIPWDRTWTTSDSAARRSPWLSGRAAAQRSGGNPASSRLLDHGPALLPQELRDIVRPAPTLARRARSLPAGGRLRPGPCARGGAGTLVHVAHAGLDLVEEALDLLGLLREDARREAIVRFVGLRDRLIEPRHFADRQNGYKQLLHEERGRERQPGDRGRDEVAAVEPPALQALPALEDRPLLPRMRHRAREALAGGRVDHRAEVHVPLRRVPDLQGLRLVDHLLDKSSRDPLMHVHTRRGAALLVLQPEGGARHTVGGGIQVRRVQHDRGVLPAHLEQARLDPLTRQALVNVHPHGLRAGEDDAVHAGVPPQRLARDLPRARQIVEHAGWNTRVAVHLVQLET